MQTSTAPRPALALVLALLLLVVPACTTDSGVTEASLEELTVQQESWDGRRVRAGGVLRTFDEPLHYWIEDEDLNRVELVPVDGLDELVGRTVRVEGTFSFDDQRGRRIEVEELLEPTTAD